MICDECKKRPANVHLTKIINGHKTEMHLCEECARAKGELDFFGAPEFSFHNLLAGLIHPEPMGIGMTMPSPYRTPRKCETCGLDYTDFTQSGFLGCSNCYADFHQQLEPLLRRIHGSTRHVGKVPGRTSGTLKIRKDIESLRAELQKCIAREEYEKAAEIRDRIHELEGKLNESA
ncbi:MAG TPA: hypothetical protein GXX51_09900 [Firmicutes bacterium]|nr:hypothetical protein [Bacillota bacterium]